MHAADQAFIAAERGILPGPRVFYALAWDAGLEDLATPALGVDLPQSCGQLLLPKRLRETKKVRADAFIPGVA